MPIYGPSEKFFLVESLSESSSRKNNADNRAPFVFLSQNCIFHVEQWRRRNCYYEQKKGILYSLFFHILLLKGLFYGCERRISILFFIVFRFLVTKMYLPCQTIKKEKLLLYYEQKKGILYCIFFPFYLSIGKLSCIVPPIPRKCRCMNDKWSQPVQFLQNCFFQYWFNFYVLFHYEWSHLLCPVAVRKSPPPHICPIWAT